MEWRNDVVRGISDVSDDDWSLAAYSHTRDSSMTESQSFRTGS